MRISKLALFSFALSITPIIIYLIRPMINEMININTLGFKLSLIFLVFPLLSIHSIILARLSATYINEYNLKGKAIVMSTVIIATLTFLVTIFQIANMGI